MTAPTLHDYPADVAVLLIQQLGADAISFLSRPTADDEYALINDALARHNGDPVAALGVTVDPVTAAKIRALPIGVRL